MGKTMDSIFRRTFKASKFKSAINLANSRLAVFKNKHQVRCNQAHSDVLQLLQQGHHQRALIRVEQVIKEQNMVDVYVLMEGYCNLIGERVHLIEHDRNCPEELREAISSLLYASTRCGDFPELQEIRTVLTSWYGKEFVARATELRNHCGVNPKMIQKLSTKQPDLDNRTKLLKEIASEHNIVLQLEEISIKTEKKPEASTKHSEPDPDKSINSGSPKVVENLKFSSEEMGSDGFSDSVKSRKKYRDVAAAAQAAYESAEYAAAAARAAVELSRSYPRDPDDQSSPSNRGRKVYVNEETQKSESELENHEIQSQIEDSQVKNNNAVEQNSVPSSATSSFIVGNDSRVTSMTLDAEELVRRLDKDIVFDESDSETHYSGSEVRKIPPVIQAGNKLDSVNGTEGSGFQSSEHLNRGRQGRFSVRTRSIY
ncbi:uncharacterized protein LOC126671608 [Mercurialis annua]|uniref:uncharacterized protein LOC126671608 n=1 Tax=Mercurialis annua TaxID=3986 RepID=UPI00215EEA8D|nr:uncharacterized protein LOC126671608 [Mercurialis annua]